jgi:hypothetical protein
MVKLGDMREHGRVVCDFEEDVHHVIHASVIWGVPLTLTLSPFGGEGF